MTTKEVTVNVGIEIIRCKEDGDEQRKSVSSLPSDLEVQDIDQDGDAIIYYMPNKEGWLYTVYFKPDDVAASVVEALKKGVS